MPPQQRRVLIAVVALAIFSVAVHVLLLPRLLLSAVGILAWIKFRPRHSHQ